MIANDSLTFFFAVILTKKKEYLRIYRLFKLTNKNKNSKYINIFISKIYSIFKKNFCKTRLNVFPAQEKTSK